MSDTAIRVQVFGKVQGVYFRQSCVEQAERLGVRGWVTNRSDGSVEAMFAGSADAVRELADWCRSGPPSARVDRVEEHPAEPSEAPSGFDVR